MDKFRAEDGNIHFLFADEDEYYTENLVKLNLQQYLNYCLRAEGFTGLFFVQDGYDQQNRYLVGMGSRRSAEDYENSNPNQNLFSFWRNRRAAPAERRSKISASGKNIGSEYFVKHPTGESLTEKIHYMLKNKRSDGRYAFVIPLDIFCRLYSDSFARAELKESLRCDNRKSVVILTASMKADDSLTVFMNHLPVFCSELFPEIQKIFASGKHFRFYEELKNEFGGSYHVFNQLLEPEITRLLQYIQLIEDKKGAGEQERIKDYAALLYAWYHYPDFGLNRENDFPSKQTHSLGELGKCLRRETGRVWRQMDAWIEEIRKNQPEEAGLKELISHRIPEETEWHPVFAENGDIRRLRRGIQGISDPTDKEIFARMHQIERLMIQPWSDYEQKEYRGLQRTLDVLEEIQNKGIFVRATAGYVLDYLLYSIRSEEAVEEEKIMQIKCSCYEQMIDISCKCEELESVQKIYSNRYKQHQAEFQRRKQELDRVINENPLYRNLISGMKDGSMEPAFVRKYAPEILQEKSNLARLNQDIENDAGFLEMKQMQINQFKKELGKLEVVISELSREKNPAGMSRVLQQAEEILRQQLEQKKETITELTKTDEITQTLLEGTIYI